MADVAERKPTASVAVNSDPPSRDAVALQALKVLRRAINGAPYEEDSTRTAIETLLEHFDYPGDDDDDDSDQREIDENELDEALARARLGEFIDCVIHLGRGLPPRYQGIADALEREMERSQ